MNYPSVLRTTIRLLWSVSLIFLFRCELVNKKTKPPNIILVMADDQGWGDMAYNGHPVLQTPYFDSMASETMRFDRFYAAAPVCSPTRGSVLTGRHPNRFGCFTWGNTLRPQEITLAEMLQKAGYVTGHFGKWHLGSVRSGSPVNPGASGFDEWFSAPNFFDNDPILSREGKAVPTWGESSMVTVDAALDFITKHQSEDQPYFVVIWFGSPHLPHQAFLRDQQYYEDQSKVLKHFYGEITAMDRAFGKLRNTVKKLDSYHNTVLWYTSDNGGLPRVGATGGRDYKGKIFEGGLRVPALLEWPARITQPVTVSIPANSSDILPTIAELAGFSINSELPLDGISLVPWISGKIDKRTQPMGFWQYPAPGVRTPSAVWMRELLRDQKQGNMVGNSARLRLDDAKVGAPHPLDSLPGHAAWLDWPWKLHRIEKHTDSVFWELYNLETDSMETRDLVSTEPGRVSDMMPQLEKWQNSVIRSLNGEDYLD